MSRETGFGWHYPAGADNDSSPWNQRECHDDCPASEYSQPYHPECEGRGECECYGPGLWNAIKRWWYGDCEVDDSPDCTCAEMEADAKADAAEEKQDWEDDR